MLPSSKTLAALATGAALAAAPAAAGAADTLVTPAPGAQKLAGGGGYLAWSAPQPGGGWRLTLRAPDGTVATPAIRAFDTATRASIGSTGYVADRRVVAVYARDGDLFRLDVRTGAETRIARASTSAEEHSPVIVLGRIAFVRKGRRGGVFVLDEGRVRRVSTARPAELGFNGTRIAYPSARGVLLHRVSGRGRDSFARGKGGTPRNVALTRYSVTFMTSPGRVFRTTRFGGSSRTDVIEGVREGTRRLPATTNSFVPNGGFIRWYLDAEGVKRVEGESTLFGR